MKKFINRILGFSLAFLVAVTAAGCGGAQNESVVNVGVTTREEIKTGQAKILLDIENGV